MKAALSDLRLDGNLVEDSLGMLEDLREMIPERLTKNFDDFCTDFKQQLSRCQVDSDAVDAAICGLLEAIAACSDRLRREGMTWPEVDAVRSAINVALAFLPR